MFLNNLDDFAMAIRMYTYANQPVSEGMWKLLQIALQKPNEYTEQI